MGNKTIILTILIFLSGLLSASAQSNYELNENDSTLKLKAPFQLRLLQESNYFFTIRLKEKIKNHVWFVSFEITNNTDEDLSVRFGSEDNLEAVTPNVTIKSGTTEIIRYKMRKVQKYAGFTQRGKITVYSKSKGSSDFDLYRNDLSGDFSIHGEWIY